MASAVDGGYLPYALVVANSIARTTNRRRPVEYHVLYSGPPKHWALPRLEAFFRRGLRVVLHPVPNPWEHLGIINGFPPSSLLRAAIPDVLHGYRRAIYLDVDLVVEDDLAELFDADLAGNPLGATTCVLTATAAVRNGRTWRLGEWGPTGAYFEQELGLVTREQKLAYTQSGVQLLDLEALRALRYGETMGALADRMRDRLGFLDQCATNKLLAGRITPISPRWNITPFSLKAEHEARVPPELIPILRQQRNARGIIHFGGEKPWRHPMVAGSRRWWRNAIGSGAFRHVVARELPMWSKDLLTAVEERHPRLFGFIRFTRLGWILPRALNTILDPVGVARRIARRLRGQDPDG